MDYRYLLIVTLISACASVKAQEYDLNDLRQAPPTNSLPVRIPAASVRDVSLDDASLDLNINYWRNWTSFSINANQATFSDNWNAGGVNSISLGSFFNTKWDYTRGDKNFISEIEFRYGQTKNENQLARKSQDRIFWDNRYSIKFARSWSFFASLSFESQFDRGFQYSSPGGVDTRGNRISNFMAPGYLTQSLGVEYKPDQYSSIRFGTGTARQTFVLDDNVQPVNPQTSTDRFGVPSPGRFRNELAFQLRADTDRDLTRNLHLRATYEFFANYEELYNARHRLDAILTARVTRVISVLFNATLLYDPLQIPNETFSETLQRSQILGIGLNYKFP